MLDQPGRSQKIPIGRSPRDVFSRNSFIQLAQLAVGAPATIVLTAGKFLAVKKLHYFTAIYRQKLSQTVQKSPKGRQPTIKQEIQFKHHANKSTAT
jgi:hypothetical protein